MPPRIAKGARGKTGPPIKKPDPTNDPQYLAPKDAALLAQVFQQYEEKKYSASIKTADLVLKKSPQNAQTLCMKGLSTYNLGKREEGRELAKKGLSLEITSHVCWHVNALVHRADREYEEALKCYIQANKVEPNDLNVLRDLINLQLFLRKYDGACIARLNLVRLQPRLRYSWTALAVAHHFNGDYLKAQEVLQAYCDMLDSVPAHDYEYSEVILYRIQLALEDRDFVKAMDIFEKEGRRIVDLQTKKEFSAQVQKGLRKNKAAELAYQELLDDNPDYRQYLEAYLDTKDLDLNSVTDDNRGAVLETLQTLSDRYPKSRMIRRAILEAAEAESFAKKAAVYIVESLTKGIPSLFSDIKGLLAHPAKRDAILQTALRMRSLMEESKTIEGDELDTDSEEAPTTYVWLLYLLAQLQLHIRQHAEALKTISAAIQHTNVLPELWMIKARIHKRAGDHVSAEEAMATARFLDGQDRYLNAKHVKYLLRIDEVAKAEETAGLFTRKDAESPLQDLTDMQCLWFLLEEGNSYRRQGNLGMALKRYRTIERIFAEMYEDEFDFHGYSMRKFTLRSCINLVRSNNVLRKHPAFLAAAQASIDIYLHLHIKPDEKPTTNGTHDGANGMSEEERRKADNKAKKVAAKAKAAAEEAKKLALKGGNKGAEPEDEIAKDVDNDPHGEKLWQTTTPLDDVQDLAKQLEALGSSSPEALALVCRVAIARGELARALKAVQKMHGVNPKSAALHLELVRTSLALKKSTSQATPAILEVLTRDLEAILPLSSTSLEQYNAQFLQKHPNDADAILSAARAQWEITQHQDKQGVSNSLMQAIRPEVGPSITVIAQALDFLQNDISADEATVANFVAKAKELYPHATILKEKAEVKAEKQAVIERRQKESERGNEDVKK